MIKDGNYDEIKESVIDTLGWSATGLCLAVIKALQEIDVWVYRWTNNDDPHHVLSHVDVYLVSHPNEVYAAMKSVLKEFNLEYEDWEWAAIQPTSPMPAHAPAGAAWAATLSFRSKHTNWTENDPPEGGYRIPNGWQYEPNLPRVGLDLHGHIRNAANEARRD